jgi:hypothetical protein
MRKYPRKQLKKKDFLWLMVSEVSAHGDWRHCFWACDEVECHDGDCVLEQSCHLVANQKAERGTDRKG